MLDFNISQIQKSKSLTNELAKSLEEEIISGKLKAGEKLPSSKSIEEQAGVSRSVVREAVAQLRAQGLVQSRQGVGVFVTQKTPQMAFVIDAEEFQSLHEAINILELRMAVETETASRAASLRSEAQLEEITHRMMAMEKTIAKGITSAEEDLNFHLAIADASGNPYFSRFIKYIGSGVESSRTIITVDMTLDDKNNFFKAIQDEHRHITNAIKMGSPEMAGAAMKAHLISSIRRHEDVVQKLSLKAAKKGSRVD